MDIGPFTIDEPVPELRQPHVLAMLRPWVDVGGVGAGALTGFEQALDPQPLGHLARPGRFFDFTRYRPTAYFKEGQREVDIPNSKLRYARGPGEHDFLFFHLLEPHASSDEYIEGLLELFQFFGARRYALLGAMYDMVPHTRPLRISGSASDPRVQEILTRFGARPSRYEGPTTILTMIPAEVTRRGMETMSVLVRLPQYAPLDEDFNGIVRLLELLSEIYDIRVDLGDLREKAEEQLRQISMAVQANPQLQRAVTHLEERYDARLLRDRTSPESTTQNVPLPPAIEQFLRELGS